MARDRIYRAVRSALVKDGWAITHEPYRFDYGGDRLYADIGAEQPLGAQREGELIVVEVKSFLGPSPLNDLQEAIGQYQLYLSLLRAVDPDRKLYLAISELTHSVLVRRPAAELALRDWGIALVIVDVVAEEVVQWIH